MKPIIRWSIGPVNKDGFKVLRQSIKLVKSIYPNFDYVVCYNQLDHNRVKFIESLGVKTVNGELFKSDLFTEPLDGYNVHWKLCPPRVQPDAYEIFLDNDILIFDRVPEIDLFLKGDGVLLYQGLNANHTEFSKMIPGGVRINSGIFGIPPNYNFRERMVQTAKEAGITTWENGEEKKGWTQTDEQGLVAATLLKDRNYLMIPLTTIPIIEKNWSFKNLTTPTCRGYHFVGVNYHNLHRGWKEFELQLVKM